MYISEWKRKEDSSYYLSTASLKKNLTPFLKIRIIPLDYQNEYSLVIRDYNSGLLLDSKNIKMKQNDDGVYTNLDTAKKAIEKMVRIFLTGEGGIIYK